MPVDPNDTIPGYRVVEAHRFCDGCAFIDREGNCHRPHPPAARCSHRGRRDGHNVIFVRGDGPVPVTLNTIIWE